MRLSVAFLVIACAARLVAGEPSGDTADVRDLLARLKQLEAQQDLIAREYVDPVERGALWSGALKGMAQTLDRGCAYLTRDEVAIYGAEEAGRFVGFGFDWRQEAGGPLVVRVVPGSPADQAGLLPGDRLVRIGDLDAVRATPTAAALALAWGGDRLPLAVEQADGVRLSCELARTEMVDDGVPAAHMLDPAAGVGYVHIARFQAAAPGQGGTSVTAIAFRAAIDRLLAANLRALVLDLRGCAGGSLVASAECADGLLPGGAVVCQQESRNAMRSRPWTVLGEIAWARWPLAVLVDGGTASAAEALAAALRDHRRAVLVGAPTAGKGTAQQLFVMPGGDALLLTIARLRAPGGDDLALGLKPAVTAAADAATTARLARRARLLRRHEALPADLAALKDEALAKAWDQLLGSLEQTGR